MRSWLLTAVPIVAIASYIYAETAASGEEAAVRKVLESYFDGGRTADPAAFERAWELEHGRMLSVRSDDGSDVLHAVPIRDAIRQWTSKPAEPSWGKIHSIDIVDDRMAAAKVEMLYRGNVYLDLLVLYKINGHWKIVHKTFVRQEGPTSGQ